MLGFFMLNIAGVCLAVFAKKLAVFAHPSKFHFIASLLSRSGQPKFQSFVMNTLGVIALGSWNRNKLDLYSNNINTNKTQALILSIITHH